MISKKQYCEIIIEDFCRSENISRKQLCEGDIYKSSSLGVAMEYLGLIKKPSNLKYIASRAGIVDTYFNPEEKVINTLTVRNMLSLLPETVENEYEE